MDANHPAGSLWGGYSHSGCLSSNLYRDIVKDHEMKMLFVGVAIAVMSLFLTERETQAHLMRFRVHTDGTVFVIRNGDLLCTF